QKRQEKIRDDAINAEVGNLAEAQAYLAFPRLVAELDANQDLEVEEKTKKEHKEQLKVQPTRKRCFNLLLRKN
ncbi:4123_t:CDS:2, partial [Ambispora leptoticha]